MAFELPELPYGKDALKPFMSAETLEFHHGKHHAGYVKKLNAAIEDTDLEGLPLEELIRTADKKKQIGVFNNAAQHFNHSFFWTCFTPEAPAEPTGKLAELINDTFGSFVNFREEFSKFAATLFGSGWVWLVQNSKGKLEILPMPNAGTPIADEDLTPILTIDVWEHAYYIDYRNARADYIQQYWNYIDWNAAEARLQ